MVAHTASAMFCCQEDLKTASNISFWQGPRQLHVLEEQTNEVRESSLAGDKTVKAPTVVYFSFHADVYSSICTLTSNQMVRSILPHWRPVQKCATAAFDSTMTSRLHVSHPPRTVRFLAAAERVAHWCDSALAKEAMQLSCNFSTRRFAGDNAYARVLCCTNSAHIIPPLERRGVDIAIFTWVRRQGA